MYESSNCTTTWLEKAQGVGWDIRQIPIPHRTHAHVLMLQYTHFYKPAQPHATKSLPPGAGRTILKTYCACAFLRIICLAMLGTDDSSMAVPFLMSQDKMEMEKCFLKSGKVFPRELASV